MLARVALVKGGGPAKLQMDQCMKHTSTIFGAQQDAGVIAFVGHLKTDPGVPDHW